MKTPCEILVILNVFVFESSVKKRIIGRINMNLKEIKVPLQPYKKRT